MYVVHCACRRWCFQHLISVSLLRLSENCIGAVDTFDLPLTGYLRSDVGKYKWVLVLNFVARLLNCFLCLNRFAGVPGKSRGLAVSDIDCTFIPQGICLVLNFVIAVKKCFIFYKKCVHRYSIFTLRHFTWFCIKKLKKKSCCLVFTCDQATRNACFC